MENKTKIMIIDDDVHYVDTVKNLLESVGYEVSYSYNGEKGKELAREIQPELILLDVMFAGPPGKDGFQVSRDFHSDPILKDIPIIIISGVRKALELSFTFKPDDDWMPVKTFLEKPVKPNKLLSEIKKILAK